MKRVDIIRGAHPNEVTAFYLAPYVAYYLRQHDYDVYVVRVPMKFTPFGLGRKTNEADRWVRRYVGANPDSFCFDFHNSDFGRRLTQTLFAWRETTKSGMGYGVVEIPAVFKAITNPVVLGRADSWVNAGSGSAIDLHIMDRFADEYMRRVVDMESSRQQGLAEDLIEATGEAMEEILLGKKNRIDYKMPFATIGY